MASKIYKLVVSPKNLLTRSTVQPTHFRRIHSAKTTPVKEIQIPTRWGHIAGKLWGSENQRPILALHGWQDNAGTWDPLAPMLTDGCSILAIDFPGHGLSSWIPPGMLYFPWDLPRIIVDIKEHFAWDKITLMCHSMGSIAGLRFATLFPNDVDGYIAVDSLIADDYNLNLVVDNYAANLKKLQIEQTRLDQEPPSYPMEALLKKWHLGTTKSVSMEGAKLLAIRGAKPSKKDPTKYFYSRDARLKHVLFNPEDKKFVETLILKLICPTLYIKAIDSPYASDPFAVEMRELIAKNNSKFASHFVPGTHHVHLNNPERVAPLIISFLKEYNLYH